ncbi:MAG: tRNA epoxyqueuosine(34) reductase QueG [Bacteroidales bacterium]|nr:tRNA epoxyqueuosine(34) reductase QueG [Bacteroidales bacterium]
MPCVASHPLLSAATVKEAALAVGFDACGIAPVTPLSHFAPLLDQWTRRGMNADMQFMQHYTDQRLDPSLMVEGAQSMICLLLSYNPSHLMDTTPRVARYAYGEDYHERMKRMLYQLIAKLQEAYPGFSGRPCVDTAPVAEKQWAARAGLGWIGRNTLLVNPQFGSWCNLGEIITPFATDIYDEPMNNGCGTCRRCVQACPNHALQPADANTHTLDARRCASYHTIENRNPSLPKDIRLSGYLFGCDICQQACPYNQQAVARHDIPADRIEQLQHLATCEKTDFRKISRHSALNRIRFEQLQRNRQHCQFSASPEENGDQ